MHDFKSLVAEMLASGETTESIAEKFTKTLNEASTANKRKEEKESWRDEVTYSLYEAIGNGTEFNYEMVGQAAALAALNIYPDFTLEELKELQEAHAEATKTSIDFYYKIKHDGCNLTNIIEDSIKGLRASRSVEDRDQDIIHRFLKNL